MSPVRGLQRLNADRAAALPAPRGSPWRKMPGPSYDGLTMLRIHHMLGHAWRASRSVAMRAWHEDPITLIAAYLVLAAAAEVLGQSAYMASKTYGLGLIPVLAFLCWRVSRGGRISRGILIYISIGDLLRSAGLGGRWWHVQPAAVSAAGLAGLLLLLSPAVYARTHPGIAAASSRMRLIPGWSVVWPLRSLALPLPAWRWLCRAGGLFQAADA